MAFAGPPHLNGWTQLGKRASLDPGRGPGTELSWRRTGDAGAGLTVERPSGAHFLPGDAEKRTNPRRDINVEDGVEILCGLRGAGIVQGCTIHAVSETNAGVVTTRAFRKLRLSLSGPWPPTRPLPAPKLRNGARAQFSQVGDGLSTYDGNGSRLINDQAGEPLGILGTSGNPRNLWESRVVRRSHLEPKGTFQGTGNEPP